MEITGKILLNSAEKILSSRNDSNKAVDATDSKVSVPESPNTAQMRLTAMQANLNDAQKSYSREQARLILLNDPTENLKNASFEGKPLFPEIKADMPKLNRDELIRTVEQSLQETRARLKSLQVEMENHLAIEFSSEPSSKLSVDSIISGMAGSQLEPERVAKLIRGQG